MFSRFLLLLCTFSLGACAYVIDTSIHALTVETPGAQDSVCHVMVDDVKYHVNPPETINVAKRRSDLAVDCVAPGNRRKSVVIPAKVSPTVFANIVNGVVPGTSWDAASGAMFTYPDKVIIDFTGMEWVSNPLPKHNNPDIRQPEDYDLEEFLPTVPRLNSDRGAEPVVLKRRERPATYYDSGAYIGSGDDGHDKSNPVSVPARKTDVYGPSAPASGDPAPLYPGE